MSSGARLEWIRGGLEDAARLVAWLSEDEVIRSIDGFGDTLARCLERGGRLFTCGNGGSMCDAMHFAEELSGRYRADRPALAATAISDPSHLTCVANDWGFDYVFARGVEAWGREGDVLAAFSTSGNSRNVVRAAEAAKARHMTVLAFLGRDGGDLRALADHALIVPAHGSDRIQEAHIKIVHLLVEYVERRLYPAHYLGS